MVDHAETLPAAARAPARSERSAGRMGGALDHVAAATAVLVLGLGAMQLLMPFLATPFTGIEDSTAGLVLTMQWMVFGAFLAIGGVLRMRVVTIFAAEFLFVAGLVGVAVTLFNHHEPLTVAIHASIAGIGLLNSGMARLIDKAELKRELSIARAGEDHARRFAQPSPFGSRKA